MSSMRSQREPGRAAAVRSRREWSAAALSRRGAGLSAAPCGTTAPLRRRCVYRARMGSLLRRALSPRVHGCWVGQHWACHAICVDMSDILQRLTTRKLSFPQYVYGSPVWTIRDCSGTEINGHVVRTKPCNSCTRTSHQGIQPLHHQHPDICEEFISCHAIMFTSCRNEVVASVMSSGRCADQSSQDVFAPCRIGIWIGV